MTLLESVPASPLPGIQVVLDNVVYHYDPENLPDGRPHAFIYFLTLTNLSDRPVIFLKRKWVITHAGGTKEIIEGDSIVGKKPLIEPGASWSFESYHIMAGNGHAVGSFHGITADETPFYAEIPEFYMTIPRLPPEQEGSTQ